MTNIKIYDNSDNKSFIEVFEVQDDPNCISIDVSFSDIEDVYTFDLSKEDAFELVKFLKKQLKLGVI